MSSHQPTLLEMDSLPSEVSSAPTGSTLPDAFNRLIQPQGPAQNVVLRDKCKRPTPEYNSNYDPYKAPRDDLPDSYSPYVFGEPLHDDRAAVVTRFPKHYTLAPVSKKPRTAWVWKLGYALINNSKDSKPTI